MRDIQHVRPDFLQLTEQCVSQLMPRHRVQPRCRKVQECCDFHAEDFVRNGKLFSRPGNLFRWKQFLNSPGHNEHLDLIARRRVSGDYATTTKDFVIRMGGDNKYPALYSDAPLVDELTS